MCTHPASLELRILDLLEALHAALHLLRSRIVSALRVLMDVQLVMLSLALVLALHDILPQNLCDGLNMLDGVVGFLCAGLEIPGKVVGVAREFSGSSESCLITCVRILLVMRMMYHRAQRIGLALEGNVGCAEELTVRLEDLRLVEHLGCGHESGGHFE
jgi:hypothetical protein